MQPRGVEYLEDSNEAFKIQVQEIQNYKDQQIKQLTERLSTLENQERKAREKGTTLPNFQHTQNVLIKSIQTAKAKTINEYATELKIPLGKLQSLPSAFSSPGFIQKSLAGDSKDLGQVRAKPMRHFTQDEMNKINQHHRTLEPNLQKLMEAAIGDDINMEFFANPVFVKGDGHIYELKVLQDQLSIKGNKAICPLNQDISYTALDIIPCNTLINATEQLLIIIESEGKVDSVQAPPRYATLEQRAARKRIPENLIPAIEFFYSQMPNKHKLLFDHVCRDPVTGQIMDDPVLLPDGFVYDRTIANYLLKNKGGRCQLNPNILFSEKDITPCHFVIKVLHQLKENIEAAIKLKQQSIKAQPAHAGDAKDLPDVSVQFHFDAAEVLDQRSLLKKREAELQQHIEKLKTELSDVQKQLADLPDLNSHSRLAKG